MKKVLKYTSTFIFIVIIIVLALYINNDIGIYKEDIEKDARSSHKIPDDWQVAKDTTETMSAMIFYDDSLMDYTFSIYVNRPGLSFGYFFRSGGSTGTIEKGIAQFYHKEYNERAFISMNRQQVSKVKIDNGNSIQTIEIESTKPFSLILPVNIGAVTIYDINGNVIESQREEL